MRVDRRFSLVRCWWAVALLAAAGLRAGPVISEFMASNGSTLQDTDGDYSDWIEVHNPDPVAVDLTGWFLTDSAGSPTKWSFPAVVLAPGEYRVVFASNKDRRLPEAELHTNFALSAGGEYLGLIRPDGAVAFEYAPSFPRQSDNVSYGLPAAEAGGVLPPTFLSTPTPGQPNPSAAVPAPTERVAFSRPAGLFTAPFSLELTGAGAGQVIRYVIRDTSQPEGEGPVLDESSPAYAAPIAIDSTVWIRAAVFAAEGSARGPIATVAYTRVAGGLAGFGSRLPLVVLEGEGQGAREKDGVDHPSWMQVFSPTEGGMVTLEGAPGFATPLTATVRGSSSAEFPKKGYNLKLTDDLGGKRALSLLGLPAHEKWALIAPWRYDRGYVSNSVVYSLSSGMGRWAPRTRLVELFYNTEGSDLDAEDYAGIYVVSDRIEVGSARVAVAALGRNDDAEPEISGGYLLKIDTPDPDEFGWRTQREVPKDEFSQVILVSPKGEDASPAQRDYIVNYVQRMEDALHADQATGFKQRTYLDYIDRASWVDHHILNTFAANPDAFERSAYFTKPRGGRLQAGPVWDFDRALGSYEDERSFRWDVWSGYGGVDHWESGWWAVLARDPEFMQDWVDRWQALRRTLFSPGQLIALAGALTDEIGPDAAARDAARWPDNLNPDGGYAAQVEHLKGWLTQRAQWIDSQFLAPPVVTAEGDRLHFAPPPGAVLVYTTDGSDPRSLGGQLAPNALVSEVPIELAADVNVHVRSYLREWEEVYPGSPWSSAVGGAATSPLSPRSRIVNLSTRALIGNDQALVLGGLSLADTGGKSYLLRAVGPSLAAFGTEGFVTEPVLKLRDADGNELAGNQGWQDGPDAARLPEISRSAGAFPLMYGGRDAALIRRLAAGSYAVEVSAGTGRAGTGMLEFYELDTFGRALNLSIRAYVRPGPGALVGGFVVQGQAHQRVLVRAVGPTLARSGVLSALENPVLTVYAGHRILASNDQWEAGDASEAVRMASAQVGAAPLIEGSGDAALLLSLAPGPYTVEVSCRDSSEGVVRLEIYDVP